jgi:hypothetical protein
MNRYADPPVPILSTSTNKKYYRDVKYPLIPLSVNDIYVITTAGDRLDILAQQYYSDATLWWIISAANTYPNPSNVDLPQDSLYLPIGTQLRIPANVQLIIDVYNQLNS